MRYHGVALDYDGTLAHDGRVDAATVAALERAVESGRRLILVTGRELDDLQAVFERLDLFARVVAENGALIYEPEGRRERPLGEPPPEAFVATLRERGVEPLSVGRVIVATWHPNEETVLETIRDLGLELQVIFNKGAVMVLPSGINKATGLLAALDELDLSPRNVLGVGDAENDHAFLSVCECAVAVANALPSLQDRCDYVTEGDHGAGVVEAIERLLDDDFADDEGRLRRRHLLLGHRKDEEIRLAPYPGGLLVAGPSGSGKSTLAGGFLERLSEHGYQFCLIDPEGDYDDAFASAAIVGDAHTPPVIEEALRLLEQPAQQVIVNLLGLALDDRPGFFELFLPRLQTLRTRLGHPHWVVVDEAHHVLPPQLKRTGGTLPRDLEPMLLISVHPGSINRAALDSLTHVAAVGPRPPDVLADFARGIERPVPEYDEQTPEGEALLWRLSDDQVVAFTPAPPTIARNRHRRKYASGELGEDKSFYFRGPEERLNLRAHNLIAFLQLAEGVDDETWLHHLRQHDYSRWVGDAIKDDELATALAEVEADALEPEASRERVRELVEERYTLPA